GDGGERVELSGGDSLALPPGRFAAHAGQSVTAGIRPEHFVPDTDERSTARLTVDVVEQLGADTLLHGHFGTDRGDLTVRLQGNQRLETGQMLPISVKPELIHLFDPASGQRREA
ncbi:MAG: TOBE domain-containing protein, partial [Alphaproteobacteria bacterium]